jgi:CheY-like chemotaxis protein
MPKKILLADDSVTIQKVVELTLAGQDFEVVTVGDGDTALQRIRELRPDVVLCDIMMPGKDGYQVCDAVKSDPSLSHIPVLLLTGAFEPFDEERARRVRSDGFLAKPFEPQVLQSRVAEMVARAMATATASAPAEPGSETPEATDFAEAFHDDDWVSQPPAPPTGAIEPIPEAPASAPASAAETEYQSLDDLVPADASDEARAAGTAAAADVWRRTTMELTRDEMRAALLAPAPADPSEGDEPGTGPIDPSLAAATPTGLSDEMVERVARRVAEIISDRVVREVAWEVVPELAEALIKQEIERLKNELRNA